MRYINSTPFPTLCFESAGPEGPIHTVVVRATTKIIPGSLLVLDDHQLPLNFNDVYFGRPGVSSLKYPSDLAPFKPMTDVILVATAYPRSKGTGGCHLSVQVGGHTKSFIVIAPHCWKKGLFGRSLSRLPSPSTYPIRYEKAFGGSLSIEGDGDSRVVDLYRSNPVGVGWLSPLALKVMDDPKVFPAPQFYTSVSDVPPAFGKEYAVEGVGAIAPGWAFRQQYVGTWKESEGDDAAVASSGVDFRFYNCAHPDLIVPYLAGDEAVKLFNMTPAGRLEFKLPGHKIVVAAKFVDGRQVVTVPALLDTLLIEPDDLRVTLVWRATVPAEAELQGLEARLIFNEEAAAKEAGA